MDICTERTNCIFCNTKVLTNILSHDISFPLGNFPVDSNYTCFKIPYNIQYCKNCGCLQTKYIGDLKLIYSNNNAHAVGNIRNNMDILFCNFILENNDINSIIEIGAGSGALVSMLIEKKSKLDITVIDTSYWGNTTNIKVIPNFFEDIDVSKLNCDTIIMSHVFEHFYNPIKILELLQSIRTLRYIYLNFPDLEFCLKNNIYYFLNSEHTFYIDNNFIIKLFALYGFDLKNKSDYNNYSVFFEFEKTYLLTSNNFPINDNTYTLIHNFIDKVSIDITNINNIIQTTNKVIYIWPCSIHTLFIISMGLDVSKINYVLDNSTHKIGKYLYGYNLLCKSFMNTINDSEEKLIILTGGNFNQEILTNINANINNTVIIL